MKISAIHHARRNGALICLVLPIVLLSSMAHAQDGIDTGVAHPDGALDRSYPELQRAPNATQLPATTVANRVTFSQGNTVQSDSQGTEAFDLNQIRDDVQREQIALERLNRNVLENRAEQGERAAQVALGVDFARESALLSFAPVAANNALSDAIRWYSLAARRGYPGAPSLDQSGVRFFPVRAARETSN